MNAGFFFKFKYSNFAFIFLFFSVTTVIRNINLYLVTSNSEFNNFYQHPFHNFNFKIYSHSLLQKLTNKSNSIVTMYRKDWSYYLLFDGH